MRGMEIGSRQDSSQFSDSDDTEQAYAHRTKLRKTGIRLALAELTIQAFLYFGKRAVLAVNAADIARSPQPCWLGQPVPGASEAPKAEASGSGFAEHGPGADAHRRELVRKVRRRTRDPLRRDPRGPRRTPRPTGRRRGRRRTEPGR